MSASVSAQAARPAPSSPPAAAVAARPAFSASRRVMPIDWNVFIATPSTLNSIGGPAPLARLVYSPASDPCSSPPRRQTSDFSVYTHASRQAKH